MDLSGTVESGRGLGQGLMAEDGIVERMQEIAGFPIMPGTLNVRLPEPLVRDESWTYLPAAEISSDWEAQSGQAGYHMAPVTIAARYRGIAFQAVEAEPGYPPDLVELLSEVHLRDALGLGNGDPISMSVTATSARA